MCRLPTFCADSLESLCFTAFCQRGLVIGLRLWLNLLSHLRPTMTSRENRLRTVIVTSPCLTKADHGSQAASAKSQCCELIPTPFPSPQQNQNRLPNRQTPRRLLRRLMTLLRSGMNSRQQYKRQSPTKLDRKCSGAARRIVTLFQTCLMTSTGGEERSCLKRCWLAKTSRLTERPSRCLNHQSRPNLSIIHQFVPYWGFSENGRLLGECFSLERLGR